MAAIGAVVISVVSLAATNSAPASAAVLNNVQMSAAVFAMVNQERAALHLPALRRSAGLNSSAHAHNIAMSRANVMSHQVSGEVGLGARISRTGYRWRAAAENIGWNSVMSTAGAQRLQTIMINEKAPADGHRQNILSRTTTQVGIDILIDYTHHKIWLTEDFGLPA